MPISINAQPLPYTKLSLHRYAKMVDINPVHFVGAVGQSVWPLSNNSCNDVWPKYSWQNGSQLSLSELAYAIKDAEDAIEDFIGYPMARTFIEEEQHPYPQFYNKDFQSYGGIRHDGMFRSVNTRWKKVISPGKRATTLLSGSKAVVYSDEDGDGFSETATISLTTSVAPCEIKVYFEGMNALPEWEIREANTSTASSGVVTLVFDSWLFVDPNLQSAMPTDEGYAAIDITTTANFVAAVDVYREYIDTTDAPAVFNWVCPCGSTSCAVCGTTSQDGCLTPRDAENGTLVPAPATYADGWSSSQWSVARSPDYVKIWYVAGDISREYQAGRTCDTLSDFWARQIVNLATARLYKPFCQCGNVTAFAQDLQIELTQTGEAGGHLFDFTAIKNPFGTRRGEFMVFRTLALGGGKRRKIISGVIR